MTYPGKEAAVGLRVGAGGGWLWWMFRSCKEVRVSKVCKQTGIEVKGRGQAGNMFEERKARRVFALLCSALSFCFSLFTSLSNSYRLATAKETATACPCGVSLSLSE